MNLTDLRDELDLRTEGVEADPGRISAAISRRVRATKRRRAGGAVCAVAVLAAALAWDGLGATSAPTPAHNEPSRTAGVTVGPDGLPSRTLPTTPDDVVKDGLRFRAQVADDRLAAAVIGDPGQRSLSVTWDPTTNHISYAAGCYLPGATPSSLKDLRVRASLPGVAGHLETGCSATPPPDGELPAGGGIPGEPGRGASGIVPGRAATLVVQLVDGAGREVTHDDARLVGAVYELGPRTEIRDVDQEVVGMLAHVLEHQGHRYRLSGFEAGPVSDIARGRIELEAPESGPFLVSYGSVGSDGSDGADGPDTPMPADPAFLGLGGLSEDEDLVQEGGIATAPQATGHGQQLTLHVLEGPAPTRGIAVIAIYVPTTSG